MTELLLNFTDERGDEKQVSVDADTFVVGRSAENDLCFADGRLSRQHVKIERFGDVFVVSDCNSSNGTTLNGAELNEPVELKNADRLNLGGGLEIEVEILSDDAGADIPAANENTGEEVAAEQNLPAATAPTAPADASGGIPTVVFWLAPVFGVFILLCAAVLFLAFGGKSEKETAKNDGGFVYSSKRDSLDDEIASTDKTPKPKPSESTENLSTAPVTSPTVETETAPTANKTSSDIEKIEQNGASFLRKIAISDPKAFLTDKQADIINAKINQLKNSAALAENFKAVKKNSAQITSLANTQNLKPQFLAIAALTKMGGAPGDPLAVATAMLPILGELKITLDNKLADDNLLIIAAYDKGAAGSPRALQSTLEALSKQTQNISPREIRTIWFLKEKGKLSDAEFNFALSFLAIGTIAQNPKDFGVNSDALTF